MFLRLVRVVQSSLWASILLLGVCLALYGQTLGFDYVWDDHAIFLDKNSLVADPLSWKLLAQPFLENASYSRPLVMFTWWLEFHFFGQQAWISHAINVILLCINVLLLRQLAWAVLRHLNHPHAGAWATLAAGLYAIHPTLVESTAWVSGRFDLLCAGLIFMTALVFIRPGPATPLRGLVVGLLALAASLSKELGIVLPALLACLWMAMHSQKTSALAPEIRLMLKTHAWAWGSLIVVSILFLALRHTALGSIYRSPVTIEHLIKISERMLPLEALKFYIGMIFFPFGKVGPYHPYPPLPLTAATHLGNLATLAVCIAIGWHAFARRQAWAWLGLAACAALALTLHFLPLSNDGNIANDRFLTTPLAFSCIALIIFPWKTLSQKIQLRPQAESIITTLLLGGWMLFSILVTTSTIPLWSKSELLWRWVSQRNPDVPTVRYNYMQAAFGSGHIDWVEEEIQRILKKDESLTFSDQLMYSKFLFYKGDAEAIPYLEGLIESLQPYHEMPDGKIKMQERPFMNPSQIVATYSIYAYAQMLYKGNLEEALKYNNISKWYLSPGQRGLPNYIEAGILYAAGRFSEADALFKENEKVYYFNRANLVYEMKSIVQFYCLNQKNRTGTNPDSCATLEKRNFFQN